MRNPPSYFPFQPFFTHKIKVNYYYKNMTNKYHQLLLTRFLTMSKITLYENGTETSEYHQNFPLETSFNTKIISER